MPDAPPTVLFIDDLFDRGPIAALVPELRCAGRGEPVADDTVAGLVTGIVPVDAATVAPYPSLRMVLTCSVGTDHLDLEALEAIGVIVANTPFYCTEEVADHALACVLGGWRGLWRLGDQVRSGEWASGGAGLLRRSDESTLGIVGLGRIGGALARKATRLGIRVLGHDPYAQPPPGVQGLALDELLASSDAVSLHLPSGGAEPLIGARELALMRPGSVIVNAARADLVDLDALIAALDAGRIGAAALDVWPEEPPSRGDPRLAAPGLLVTPHEGWSSAQAEVAYIEAAADSLRAVLLDGGEPPSRVR